MTVRWVTFTWMTSILALSFTACTDNTGVSAPPPAAHAEGSAHRHDHAIEDLDLADAGSDGGDSEDTLPEPSAPARETEQDDAAGAPAAEMHAPAAPQAYQPRTRTYYIAAEEVAWNYAPDGRNVMMDRPFTPEELIFVEGNGVDRIGSTYHKAIYREYTDASFAQPKARAPQDAYQGMLGPIIRGVVGDTLLIVFRNSGTRHYSVHAHGVLYDKASEGAETNDGTSGQDKLDDMVEPGQTYTYTWHVAERSGPGPADPSSIAWLYHSHTDDGIADEYAGLVGAIIISDAAHGTESGVATDVDRELVHLFMVDDENSSVLADENITTLAPEADPEDEDFGESNLMHSLNGYVYANGPHPHMMQGDRVRWHLLTLGTEVDLHTPHWHGNTVLNQGHRTDVVELLPATMRTVDMIPDNPGIWMFHCHVNDHITAGMGSLYEVVPRGGSPVPGNDCNCESEPEHAH